MHSPRLYVITPAVGARPCPRTANTASRTEMLLLRQATSARSLQGRCSRAAPHENRLHTCRLRPLAAHPTGQQRSQAELQQQQQQQQQQQRPQQQQQDQIQQQQHKPPALDTDAEEEEQRAEELLQELVQHPQEVEQLLLEAAEREGDMCVSPAYIDAIVDAITHPEIGRLDHQAGHESATSRPPERQQP